MVQEHEARPGSEFIFVAGPGRCGTSLLAGILAQQGAWTGNARTAPHQRAPKGFYENTDFRAWLRDVCEAREIFPDARRGVQEGLSSMPQNCYNKFIAPLKAAGWAPGTPIVLKNPLVVYAADILDAWFPYAQWVIAKRPTAQIVQSQMAGYGGDPEQWEKWVEWYYNTMMEVPTFELDVQRIVNMDVAEHDMLRDVADRAGLETWDDAVSKRFIVPGAMHV